MVFLIFYVCNYYISFCLWLYVNIKFDKIICRFIYFVCFCLDYEWMECIFRISRFDVFIINKIFIEDVSRVVCLGVCFVIVKWVYVLCY